MKEVAAALGRDKHSSTRRSPSIFTTQTSLQPPNGSGPRRRTQQGCRACGNCDIGCEFRAKNTLDFNYLAIAEDRWDDDGQPYADIRTLAEVTGIQPIDLHHPETGYSVTYQDRLCGSRQEHVEARWVFVCAGAVNSTELLLSARSPRFEAQRRARAELLRQCDALGLAYDSKRDVEPARGPTITTSLLFERDGDSTGGPPEWFLLQTAATLRR